MSEKISPFDYAAKARQVTEYYAAMNPHDPLPPEKSRKAMTIVIKSILYREEPVPAELPKSGDV